MKVRKNGSNKYISGGFRECKEADFTDKGFKSDNITLKQMALRMCADKDSIAMSDKFNKIKNGYSNQEERLSYQILFIKKDKYENKECVRENTDVPSKKQVKKEKWNECLTDEKVERVISLLFFTQYTLQDNV